jgi:hypothetical protein
MSSGLHSTRTNSGYESQYVLCECVANRKENKYDGRRIWVALREWGGYPRTPATNHSVCQCHLGVFVFIDQTRISSKQKKSSSNKRQHWSDEYCILSIPKICFNCFIWLFNSSCFLSLNSLFDFCLFVVNAGLHRQNFWHSTNMNRALFRNN